MESEVDLDQGPVAPAAQLPAGPSARLQSVFSYTLLPSTQPRCGGNLALSRQGCVAKSSYTQQGLVPGQEHPSVSLPESAQMVPTGTARRSCSCSESSSGEGSGGDG